MLHVRVFLPWEIRFNEIHLNGGLDDFVPYADFLQLCINEQYPVTANQIRKLAKKGPHPDKERGGMFVFLEDPGEKEGDNTIPKEIAVAFAKRLLKELGDSSIVKERELGGGLPLQEIKALYPDLFNLAGDVKLEEEK